jgi:hypothetical protein
MWGDRALVLVLARVKTEKGKTNSSNHSDHKLPVPKREGIFFDFFSIFLWDCFFRSSLAKEKNQKFVLQKAFLLCQTKQFFSFASEPSFPNRKRGVHILFYNATFGVS